MLFLYGQKSRIDFSQSSILYESNKQKKLACFGQL